MKRLIGVVCGVWVACSVMAADVPPLPQGSNTAVPALPVLTPTAIEAAPMSPLKPLHRMKSGAFDLRYVSVGQLVDLLYGDAMRTPHVIDSDVLQDTRLVSFNYDATAGDLRAFVKVFLDSQGFKVETRDGVDFVSKKPANEGEPVDRETFVYRPRYRTTAYLAKALQPLFAGRFNASDTVVGMLPASDAVPPSAETPDAAASADLLRLPQDKLSQADELVFTGKASEVRDLVKLLPELDQKPGEVMVRGWVFEVSNTADKNSAFSLVAKLFNGVGGSLSATNGPTDTDPTALRFSSSSLNFVISALNADTRFTQISDPHVRVLSGDRVRLNVGSQVPTLGSISYQGQGGTPVQSVQYQDAGLIFDVRPTVMADAIQVELQEQMSSFVATTTGVNNSPTKNTRQMQTTVSMKDGEVIVLGGLVQDTDAATRNSPGWLPRFLDGHSASKGRTEVLLVLQVLRL